MNDVTERFSISIRWSEREGKTAADATTGRIGFGVGGEEIWPLDQGPEVELVDLLEFLAANWESLLLEQTFPAGLDVDSPAQLLEFAKVSARQPHVGTIAARQMSAFEFLESHDLSRAFSGFYFPWVVLLRQGSTLSVFGEGVETIVDLKEATKKLTCLADQIVVRLRASNSDNRAIAAMKAWEHKKASEPIRRFQYATGLDETYLKALPPSGQKLEGFLEIRDLYRESEMLAAARMVGPEIAPTTARKLISRLKRCEKTPAPQVTNLAHRLARELQLSSAAAPYEQGYEVAHWFRKTSKLSDSVDVREILYGWNVHVFYEELEPTSIDAIACWGSSHGPAIIVNKNGRRSRHNTGFRSTLAHELCHLIVDRQNMLPAAEVLGGRMPRRLEQRADAFAAELLLPREEAKKALAHAPSLDSALAALSIRFKVSRHLTALQIMNSGTPLTSSEQGLLERAAHIIPYWQHFHVS